MKRQQSKTTPVFRAVLLSSLALAAASIAFPQSVIDISPSSSTLDSTNPNGASGGRINRLAVKPGDNQVFYAASEWGGIFKSNDGGQNWRHMPGHVPVATWDVAVDLEDTDRAYATSFYDGREDSIAGISISTDGGVTWIHPATAVPPEDFCFAEERRTEPRAYGIAIDPEEPANIFVGTGCGLAVSNDHGDTWGWIDPTPGDAADDIWDVVVHDGGIVDVCGNDGHLRRDTAGNWSTATGAALPGGQCSLAVSPDEPDTLFAVSGLQIFETTNGGASWPTTYVNPNPQGRIPFVVVNDRVGSAFDLWFADVNLFRASCSTPAGGGGGARCPASGSWTNLNANAHADAGDLVFDSEDDTDSCPTLFSNDGGIYVNTTTSSPGCQTPTWEQPSATPHALYVLDLEGVGRFGSSFEEVYIGNQDNGSFGATNAGSTSPAWSNQDCCDVFDVAATASNVVSSLCCITPGPANQLVLSTAGMPGGTRLAAASRPPGNVPTFRFLDTVASFGPNDFVVITTSGIFITQNINASPVTWTQLGATTSPFNPCGIQVAFNGSTPSFFVKSRGCNGNRVGTLFRFDGTTATGNWTQVQRTGAGGFGVFAVDANDPDRILASDLNGPTGIEMVLTEDGGTTWDNLPQLDDLMTGGGEFRINNNTGPTVLPGSAAMVFSGYPQPNMVAISPGDGDYMIAGAVDAGVFVSSNGGGGWARITDPMTPGASGTPHIPRPRYAHFEHRTGFSPQVSVWIGSQGRGVWKANLERPVSHCDRVPALCGSIDFDRDIIFAECLIRGCRLLDPVPRNCMLKWDCPGCTPNGLCPPWFNISIEDPDHVWRVDLIDQFGQGVPHELSRTDRGVVISFRPSKGDYVEGFIGDYFLELRMGPKGELGKRYKLPATVSAGDRPFRAKGVKPVQRYGRPGQTPKQDLKIMNSSGGGPD